MDELTDRENLYLKLALEKTEGQLAACQKELAGMTASRDFYKEENQSFGNVLAIIHRDGGHYIAEHGHVKASRDAIKILDDRQKELAEAKEQIKEMNSLANALKKDGNFDSRIEKIITKGERMTINEVMEEI